MSACAELKESAEKWNRSHRTLQKWQVGRRGVYLCDLVRRCDDDVPYECAPGPTSVPAALPGVLVFWQGAVAVGPVRQAAFLLHNVQLVLVI